MTKRFKRIGFGIFLSLFLIGLAFIAFIRYSNTYRYAPRWQISDYEFIANDKAVVVRWEDKSDWLFKVMSQVASRTGYSGGILTKQSDSLKYFINESYKLKGFSAAGYDGNGKSSEFWFLDIYHYSNKQLHHSKLDIFEVAEDYQSGSVPYKTWLEPIIYKNSSYILIAVGPKVKEHREEFATYLWIDLDTKEVFERPSTAKIYRDVDAFLPLSIINSTLSIQHIKAWSDKVDIESELGEIRMKTAYPKAHQLLSEQGGLTKIYPLTTDIEVNFELVELLTEAETDIFKNVIIPSDYSIDGQEHTVQTKEEFLKYYKSPQEDN